MEHSIGTCILNGKKGRKEGRKEARHTQSRNANGLIIDRVRRKGRTHRTNQQKKEKTNEGPVDGRKKE